MSFLDHTIDDFLDQVDSKSPAPGGGSVSALSGLLGISLARMVGHLTIGRKAFTKLTEEEQQTFQSAFERLHDIQAQMKPLIDKDTEAFNGIMDAYRLPKDTEADQQQRDQAIEEATIVAIEVPMQVASLGLDALTQLQPIAEFGNKNAISDVGVATLELLTAVRGALLNVSINLPGLSDAIKQASYSGQVAQMKKQMKYLVHGLLDYVDAKL